MSNGKPQRRTDENGVVWIESPDRPRLRLLFGVALVAAMGAIGFWLSKPKPQPPPQPVAVEPPREVKPAPPAATPQPAPREPIERARRQVLEEHPLPPAEEPAPREVLVEQLPQGDGTDIDAYPRPGTKLLRAGIIVPDGYALPPGYLRHYQTTDDGEQLPPILMFHADVKPLGPDGQPVALPEDLVVPRGMAPPGMPVQWFEPPPPRRK